MAAIVASGFGQPNSLLFFSSGLFIFGQVFLEEVISSGHRFCLKQLATISNVLTSPLQGTFLLSNTFLSL